MNELNPLQRKMRIWLVAIFFILVIVFLVGIFWLVSTPASTVGLTLSFAAGLSMIVLPCTFPLVFVIVPMAMGQHPRKGLMMAILFGLGLIITLSIYGIVIAWAGQILGMDTITKWMFLIAGSAALLFGIAELKLIQITLPSYGGAVPDFIQRRGDYLKAFFMGLFLGNAGVACPNPATYIILAYIASTGSIWQGAALQSVNGLGRFLPLLAVTILAIIGVNSSMWVMSKKAIIQKITAWTLVLIGAFIITMGVYGHSWFEGSVVHELWNQSFEATVGEGAAEYEAKGEEHGGANDTQSALILLSSLIIIPTAWYGLRKKSKPENK